MDGDQASDDAGPQGASAVAPFEALRPATSGDPLELYRAADRPAPAGRPWVMANFVAGIDGSIAIDGRADGLSSAADQVVFDLVRSLADVVLVGAGTFRAERYPPIRLAPELRSQREARGQPPVPPIAVVSRSLQLDWARPSFTKAEQRPLVVTCGHADGDARERAGEVADVVVAGEDHVDVTAALGQLHRRGHRLVLCEGGAALTADLLTHDLLDELCLTVSPLIGGDPIRIVADEPRPPLTRFSLVQVLTNRDELYLRYRLSGREESGARGQHG